MDESANGSVRNLNACNQFLNPVLMLDYAARKENSVMTLLFVDRVFTRTSEEDGKKGGKI